MMPRPRRGAGFLLDMTLSFPWLVLTSTLGAWRARHIRGGPEPVCVLTRSHIPGQQLRPAPGSGLVA
jgi:hypothetical protein